MKNLSASALIFLVSGLPLTAAVTASPVVAIQNVSSPDGLIVGSAFGSPGVTLEVERAAGFRTGTSAAELNIVTLFISNVDSPVVGFQLRLYQDNGGVPGNLVAQLNGPASPTSGAINFLGNGVPLNADTLYWLVASVTDGSLAWAGANQNISDAGGDSFLEGWRSVRGLRRYDSGTWTAPFNQSPKIALTVTPVPEPGPAAFIALFAGVLCLKRRRLS